MKIKRSELLASCKAVFSGVAVRELIPQSSCFVFKGNRVYAYNDEVAVSYPVKVGFDGAIPAKEFLSFLNKTKADEISLVAKDGELVITAGKATAGFRLDINIILPIEDIEEPEEWNDLPDTFCKAIEFCLFSASKEESKAILMNIHINGQYAESCDNYRITRFDMGKPAAKVFPDKLLIPAESVKNIISHIPTEYATTDGWLHFRNEDDVTYSCRTFNDTYPDFSKFLNCEGEEVVFPSILPEILDRGGVISNGSRISIILEENNLIVCTESDTGWFEEAIEIEYDGEDSEFEIQPEFLKSILKHKGTAIIGEKVLKFESDNFQHCVLLLAPKKK